MKTLKNWFSSFGPGDEEEEEEGAGDE